MSDPLIALKTSLRERLAALREVPETELPPALLDISVRRVGIAYYVCPANWEQLRHEEGGAGRPVPYWARPWSSGVGLAGRARAPHPPPPPPRPRAGTSVGGGAGGPPPPGVAPPQAGRRGAGDRRF